MVLRKKSKFSRKSKVIGITVALILILMLSIAAYVIMQSNNSSSTLIPTDSLYPTSPTYIENVVLQEGNTQPQTKIQPKKSEELEDNHIGTDVLASIPLDSELTRIRELGVKWIRVGFWPPYPSPGPLLWQQVLRAPGVYVIDKDVDDYITGLADSGVNIVLTLSAGAGLNDTLLGNSYGKGWGVLGDTEPEWWFKTQQERDNFTDFARFMVQHFKGRIKYYEIWNEPNCGENIGDPRGGITLDDYRSLVKQVAVAIRQEDPEAKIVAGAVGGETEDQRDWLLKMLEGEVAPLVDFVSLHHPSGESPKTDANYSNTNWRDYVSNVETFKRQAALLGFRGGYMIEEMVWRTLLDYTDERETLYTDIEAAKYASRAIIRSLNLNFTMVSNQIRPPIEGLLPRHYVIRSLCTVMAGAKPASLPLQVISNAANIKNATFVLPSGDLLVALWNDDMIVYPEVTEKANVTINGVFAQTVTGIDTLNGFQQPLEMKMEGENLTVPNLLVGDYPLILHMSAGTESTPGPWPSAPEFLLWIIPILAITFALMAAVFLWKRSQRSSH
jgi:hypothetical protein